MCTFKFGVREATLTSLHKGSPDPLDTVLDGNASALSDFFSGGFESAFIIFLTGFYQR